MELYAGRKTIREIAEEAGVSVATVSRYLNSTGNVSQKAQNKIQIIVDKYNYKPNQIAKHLSLRKTETIGLVLPDITNPFFAEVSRTVEQAALDKGYAVMICNTLNRFELEQRYLNDLTARRVDGIILLGGSANEVDLDQGIIDNMRRVIGDLPLVLIDGSLKGIENRNLMQDTASGLSMLLNHLFDHGHKKISFMGGIETVSTFVDKVGVYKKLMSEQGYEAFTQVITGGFSFRSGYETMQKFIKDSSNFPTAILSINDIFAGGIIRACHENGIHVPGDISVSGFDNTEYCEMMNPSLTSLGIDYLSLGRDVVDVMLGLNGGENKLLDLKLVCRESTGPSRHE